MATVVEPDRLETLLKASEPFLRYLVDWEAGLQERSLEEVIRAAGGPQAVAVHVIDITVAFAESGRLASPRIAAVVPAIVALLRRANKLGVTRFVLPQNAHPLDSPQFEQYGPHAVVDTREAQTMPALQELPFSNEFVVIPKRSIQTAVATELEGWLASHPEVTRHLVTGDCTDICVYQHATYLKARANALGMETEVLVPEECVQTYDLPVEDAAKLGGTPHDGDLLHLVFLYHMMLNGVQVVRGLR